MAVHSSDYDSNLPDSVGPLDRPDLAFTLVLFTGAGVALGVWGFPDDFGTLANGVMGGALGFFGWLFPYLNRVLEG